jgi:hypothetical protein
MTYGKIRKNPVQFLSLTGFTFQGFETFLPAFKYQWDEYNSPYTLKGKARERISYGRKSGLLPLISDKWLFILDIIPIRLLSEQIL